MITVRKSDDRGHFDHGWLNTFHTFSFADYYDPEHMNFRTLRVINEDRVAPGEGFGTHPHRDMEILSYVVSGALEHKDSMGNGSVIRPGDVQRMSAGRGVTHSEFNPSPEEPAHFLQIWILPDRLGLEPGYEQKTFGGEEKRDLLRLLASGDGREGSVTVHQDASVYATLLSAGRDVSHAFAHGRSGWVQVIAGSILINGAELFAGDGGAIEEEPEVRFQARQDSHFLLFDLA